MQLFENNCWDVTSGTLSASATSIGIVNDTLPSVLTGDGNHFLLTLIGLDGNGNEDTWEIIKVTDNVAQSITIERAQEGTTAQIWPSGTRMELRMTSETFDKFEDSALARDQSRNWITNGRFNVCAREAEQNITTLGTHYCMDRWFANVTENTTVWQMQHDTNGDGDYKPNGRFNARVQRDVGVVTGGSNRFGQCVESTDVYNLAGKTVTISYWARKGANFSGASGTELSVRFKSSTTYNESSDDLMGFLWDNEVTHVGEDITLNTLWTKYTHTVTLPEGIRSLALYWGYNGTTTAGADDYYDVAMVQLEIGGQATAYKDVDWGIEIAMCQRFYQRNPHGWGQPWPHSPISSTNRRHNYTGSTQTITIRQDLPVQMARQITMVGAYGDINDGADVARPTMLLSHNGFQAQFVGVTNNGFCDMGDWAVECDI